MGNVNKVNEDIAIAKIALLESRILVEISDEQKKSIEDFVEKSQKIVELFLEALSKENVNSTAIKGFLEKVEEKQREYLEKIQSGTLKPKDEKKSIEGIQRINSSFSGFASAIKEIPKIGLTIKDYKKVLQKELEDSGKENRASKKLSEVFPNDWKKFSAALSSTFNSKVGASNPNELGISWDTNAVVSEIVNMPVSALAGFTGKIKQSAPAIPAAPAGGTSPSPTAPAPNVKIKDIFKGANEQAIEKFNEKFKSKFGFELSDKDNIQAIIDAM